MTTLAHPIGQSGAIDLDALAGKYLHLPIYRLEDIFAQQGFEISCSTQSVWCGGAADLVEPLY